MKRSFIAAFVCAFLLLASSSIAVRADYSVQWDSDSDWTIGATYTNARVQNGSVDIGIYPPEPDFSGSTWSFSTSAITSGIDDLQAGRSNGLAYFYCWGDYDPVEAYGYATNTFYIDTTGVSSPTLQFWWKADGNPYRDFSSTGGTTTLKIMLQKPTGSWYDLWSKTKTAPWTSTETGTESINLSAYLTQSGNYTIKIQTYWYFTSGWFNPESFSWSVDNISCKLKTATHTSSWKDVGATSAWKTIDYGTSIGSGQSISAQVQVSDDQSTTKGTQTISLSNGTNSYSITSLPSARYVRVVSSLATSSEANTPQLDNYKVTANRVPTISSGSVTPDNGPFGTTFTYSTTYTDQDGDAPSYVKVYVDGTGYDMTKILGDYTSGATYQFLTATLSKGSHSYYFSASDGTSAATSSSASGPTVGVPPSLASGSVSPSSGSVGSTFTYDVTYTDADGDAPSYIKVYIDGSAYDMTKIGGTYTAGATYRYTTSSLSTGSHTYYFTTSDGTDTDRLPSSGTSSGPTVETISTTLTISSSSPNIYSGGIQTFTATITASGSSLTGKTITWAASTGSLSATSGTTNSSGQVMVTYTAPSVTTQTSVTITASFAGDTNYQLSNDSFPCTVSPVQTTPSSASSTRISVFPSSFTLYPEQNTPLTATLASGSNSLTNKTITWTASAGTLSATSGTTNSTGQVSVIYTAPGATSSTSVTITVSFAGDSSYQTSSGSSSGAVIPQAVATVETPTVGQTVSVEENGISSVTAQSATTTVVNFESAQPVKSITIETSAAVQSVSVQTQQSSQKPTSVTEPTATIPGVTVSHYLDITVTPTAQTSVTVENATIEFKVSKSWLTSNNIDPATVELMRYSNGWTELPTSATTEDTTDKYYSATTSGFSTFAVTGKAVSAGSNMMLLVVAVVVAGLAGGGVVVWKKVISKRSVPGKLKEKPKKPGQANVPSKDGTIAYIPVMCPKCNHPNLPHVKHCAECGNKLGENSVEAGG